MATYYVNASTGSNGNAGTSTGTAWKTLGYAFGQLAAGDTLNLMDDAVFDLSGKNAAITMSESGTDGNPITIQSYSGNTGYPIIDGGWRDDGTMPDYSRDSVSGEYGFLVEISGSYVNLDGIAFKGSPARCLGISYCANVNVTNCIAYENFSAGMMSYEADDILFEDCEVLYSVLRQLPRYQNKTTPDGLKIYNWPPPMYCAKSTRTTFRRCLVHDNGGEGIDIYASRECVAEYCVCWNNDRTQYYVDWAGRDSRISNCVAFETDAHKIRGGFGPYSGVGDNGLTIRDEKTGSGAQKNNIDGLTRGLEIYNNLVVNCGTGLSWSSLANLASSATRRSYIAHNTFVNNFIGLQMEGPVSKDGQSGVRWWDGCIFENNLFTGNERMSMHTTSGSGVTVRNNLWQSQPTQASFRSDGDIIDSTPNLVDPDVAITSTLPVVFDRITGEYEAGDSYTVVFDKANYYLMSSSPAISAAFRSSRINIDIRDADRDSSPDIGCHEYGGEVTPVLSAGFTLSADQVTPNTTVNITSTASMTAGTIDTWAYHYSLDDVEWTSIGTSEDETFTPTADGEYRIRQTVTDTETADTKYYYRTLVCTSYDEDEDGDAGTVPTAGNLLTNGDFSNGTTNWSKTGTVTMVEDNGRLKITNPSGAAYINQSGFEMVDGGDYIIAFDLELSGTSDGLNRTIDVQVIQDNTPFADVIERYSVTAINNGGVLSYSSIVSQSLGSTESDCRLRFKIPYIYPTGSSVPQYLYLDNVVVAANIEVTAAFSADDSTPSVGQTVDFTDSSTGATSWQWYVKRSTEDDDGYDLFSTAQNPSWTVPSEGVYTVKLVAAQGNVTDSTTSTLTTSDWTDWSERGMGIGLQEGTG